MRNDIMGVLFDNLTLAEAVDAGERLAAYPRLCLCGDPQPGDCQPGPAAEDYRQVLNGAGLVPPTASG